MAEDDGDIQLTKETKKNLIYETGWLTVLPIGIWYIFDFLFNVGALYFYGINSGYSRMRIEIDFFSLIFTGCFFVSYFVFIYSLLKERVKLYKVLTASCIFLITTIFLFLNLIIGTIVGIALTLIFTLISKKGFFSEIQTYKKNIIIFTSFVSFVMLSFYSGHFYSKKFSDYYCIDDEALKPKVLIARTDENTGIFITAYNENINSFDNDKYEIHSLIDIKLKKCSER